MPRSKRGGRLQSILFSLIFVSAVAPRAAEAGRRPFLFAYDSEIVPDGDVELEEWWWSESRIPTTEEHVGRSALYWFWFAPVFGLSNHLELALPFQIVAASNTTAVQSFWVEGRYRFFPREKEGGFQPLVRFSYRQAIQARVAPSSVDMDLVVTYGKATELHLSLDAGVSISLPWPENLPRPVTGTFSGGLAYPLSGEFRLSAEVLAEIQGNVASVPSNMSSFPRYFAGGAVSWTRGRVWITAGTMVGLTGLSAASPPFIPRLLWAVAL